MLSRKLHRNQAWCAAVAALTTQNPENAPRVEGAEVVPVRYHREQRPLGAKTWFRRQPSFRLDNHPEPYRLARKLRRVQTPGLRGRLQDAAGIARQIQPETQRMEYAPQTEALFLRAGGRAVHF